MEREREGEGKRGMGKKEVVRHVTYISPLNLSGKIKSCRGHVIFFPVYLAGELNWYIGPVNFSLNLACALNWCSGHVKFPDAKFSGETELT